MGNYYQNPGNAPLRDYSPGPHSGVDGDPGAQLAPDSIASRARTALTLGVLSLLVGVLAGIPAIWVGIQALRHIASADRELKGRWAAWTGIGLGAVGCALTFALWLYLHTHG